MIKQQTKTHVEVISFHNTIDIWKSERICACKYIDYLIDKAYLIKHTDEERSERMNKYL